MELLNVLESADFSWARHIEKIWADDPADVAGIHADVRRDFVKALGRLAKSDDDASPHGWVVNGPGGSGKTHLLAAFRRETLARGGFYIIVDMSGVKNFWETLLLHAVRSIRTAGPDGRPQVLRIIDRIVTSSRIDADPDTIHGLFQDNLAAVIKKAVNGLYRVHGTRTQEYQDVLRAVMLLASDDIDISDCGYRWILGLESDATTTGAFGFTRMEWNARRAVAGLSWLMSLDGGFSVFALDQLDAIVMQNYNPNGDTGSEEAATARHIIVGLCDGLLSLRDMTHRTLVVVSCLNDSWRSLSESGLQTAVDRYASPIRLPHLTDQRLVEALVGGRMSMAFAREGMTAPYPTWPFPPAVLAEMTDLSPRIVLQRCDQHIRNCLKEGIVREATRTREDDLEPVLVSPVTSSRFEKLERRFQEAWQAADPAGYRDKGHEDDFWHRALAAFARAVEAEQPPRPDADILAKDDDNEDAKFPLLHAMLQYVPVDGDAGQRHLGVRALLQTHHRAFQPRLKAAMTQAGIDRKLSFRKLVLVNFGDMPGGKVTAALLEEFASAGGVWVTPDDGLIRSLAALLTVEEEFPAEWRDWVAQTMPVTAMGFLRDELAWLTGDARETEAPTVSAPVTPLATPPSAGAPPTATPRNITPSDAAAADGNTSAPEAKAGDTTAVTPEPSPKASPETAPGALPKGKADAAPSPAPAPAGPSHRVADPSATIPIGSRATNMFDQSPVTIPLETLKQHVAILAGNGSGKTILTKRLVEEAALAGTPAIVIDVANDLARMGQRWPETPESWQDGDAEKADRYFASVDVKIWTPGRSGGNPLRLRRIPDLAAVAGDDDELSDAVAMSLSTLRDILKFGTSGIKEGIAAAALRYLTRHGRCDLNSLAAVLEELPEDSGAYIHDKAERYAKDMAGNLRGALLSRPLLASGGDPTDIAELLTAPDGRPRVSVINLSGLGGSTEAQQEFVNELAMTLFSWIKAHPVNGLGGLLVIDEAKDFVPSLRSTPCKDSVVRFAAQARKYGMGLILATQEPKSVETKIIANCNTQFFGRQNSPATIKAAEDLLQKRGVARLERGNFFVKSIALGAEPVRIVAPLCLTHHSPAPLSGEEVAALAR